MISYKPFSPSDWYGFAGAERFEDGAEPLLGELKVDDFDAIIIIDASGVHISWDVPVEPEDDGTQHEETLTNTADFDAAHASRAVALLKSEMTTDSLRQLGARLVFE